MLVGMDSELSLNLKHLFQSKNVILPPQFKLRNDWGHLGCVSTLGRCLQSHVKDKNKSNSSMEEMSKPLWSQEGGHGPGH